LKIVPPRDCLPSYIWSKEFFNPVSSVTAVFSQTMAITHIELLHDQSKAKTDLQVCNFTNANYIMWW
jgi:hypothetical protein